MRKTYVKPVMESEAFVANEYVAACYQFTFTCNNFGCWWGDDRDNRVVEADSLEDAVSIANRNQRDTEIIHGSEGNFYHTSDFNRNHTISVSKKVINKQYPNASV